ncbi:4Fe-4S binding protein [Desulfobacterales bacterium HSG17]|nr:4Fe-4S binding protein [Desulfobacterales bacterium HSG17]
MGYPVVDEAKCVGCEECVDICPQDVFEMQNDKSVVVEPDECVDCESCLEACEEDAIELKE